MKPVRDEFLAFGKPNFGDGEIAAVARVMRAGWVGMGPEVIAFEKELGEFVGAPHVISVNSCTSALFLSLLVNGVGPGDEVICQSLTWCATANAALYLGATPVLCDVDEATLCVSPETILPHVTDRTKAVIVVHMGGVAIDIAALREVIPARVRIVEDAAHALGSFYPDGSPVGSSGNLVCYSFYANKNLSTGEGGAIALFDANQAERLRSVRQSGLSSDAWKRYISPQHALVASVRELGYKMNFTDLQAAIGRVQLARQPEFQKRRLEIAEHYARRLKRAAPDWRLQKDALDERHARHLLIAVLPGESTAMTRNDILLALRERNIGASIHYPPLHHMDFYRRYAGRLPVTDRLASQIMTLPISASMSLADVDFVVDQIADLLQG